MAIYSATVEAKVRAVLRVIADTTPEAKEKAERMVRNDIVHDLEVTAVTLVEDA